MVRSPCCESMGLKKGPWTREEDQILINYINMYGHDNWRALPKLAGLLRCGKSCRLRWTNYLKPDIKRGNFTREEEQTIIQLHATLGNRWSAIAAQLPGRTDNEIKNVWHTHLKKRMHGPENRCEVSYFQHQTFKLENEVELSSLSSTSKPLEVNSDGRRQTSDSQLSSPQHFYSEITSTIAADGGDMRVFEKIQKMDEDLWTKIFSDELTSVERDYKYTSNMNNDMQFWINVFTRGEELLEIQIDSDF